MLLLSTMSAVAVVAMQFMQMALKAAAGSRATIEALANLNRPDTTARVHVSGGQAIVAEQFHHHPREGR